MNAIGSFLMLAAEYLPVWRDAVVLVLALVVIGCLWVSAEVLEP